MRTLSRFALAVALTLSAASCVDDDPDAPPPPAEEGEDTGSEANPALDPDVETDETEEQNTHGCNQLAADDGNCTP